MRIYRDREENDTTLAILVFFKKIFCRYVKKTVQRLREFFVVIDLVSYLSVDLTMLGMMERCQELYQTLSWISARCSLRCTPPGLAALYISSRLFTRATPSINYNFNDRILPGEWQERYLENKR